MESFVLSGCKWVPSDSYISYEANCNLDGKKSIKFQSIRHQLSELHSISSAHQFNQFVRYTRSITPGLAKGSPLIVITNFRNSSFMKKEIFHVNLMKNLTQLYHFDNDRKNILVCFCGNANALNIHLSIFQATFSQLFGSIAYVCREDRSLFLENVESLLDYVPAGGRLSFLGCSAGAHIPLLLKLKYPDSGALSFSPTKWRELHYFRVLANGLNPHFKSFNSAWAKNTRIYYAGAINRDEHFTNACRYLMDKNTFNSVFVDISDLEKNHSTLQTLYRRGLLRDVLEDLCLGRLSSLETTLEV